MDKLSVCYACNIKQTSAVEVSIVDVYKYICLNILIHVVNIQQTAFQFVHSLKYKTLIKIDWAYVDT